MNYQISYETNPTSEDIQVLNDGIMEQAKQKKGMRQLDFFAFFILCARAFYNPETFKPSTSLSTDFS